MVSRQRMLSTVTLGMDFTVMTTVLQVYRFLIISIGTSRCCFATRLGGPFSGMRQYDKPATVSGSS